MQALFDVNQALLENLFASYRQTSNLLLSKISQDKSLNKLDRFNKRFQISWGMEIQFNDALPITNDNTRACYALMLKISDLWFAFEHLVQVATDVIPKDQDPNSKIDLYQNHTLDALGFNVIASNFNQLMNTKILHRQAWQREVHRILTYLVKRTKGGTKKELEVAISLIHQKHPLQVKHGLAIAYGIRNIYVHEGVVAALGSGNYHIKRSFYSVIYDALVLYSLALADFYCRTKLSSPIGQFASQDNHDIEC